MNENLNQLTIGGIFAIAIIKLFMDFANMVLKYNTGKKTGSIEKAMERVIVAVNDLTHALKDKKEIL